MADPKIEDHSDEMAEQLGKLDDHIDDARKKLQGRKEAAGIEEDVAGDSEGEQDHGQGDDPSGAHEAAEEGEDSGSDGDDDDPVDEEYASPT